MKEKTCWKKKYHKIKQNLDLHEKDKEKLINRFLTAALFYRSDRWPNVRHGV